MTRSPKLLLLSLASITLLGCDGEKRQTKEDRIAKDLFFEEEAVSNLSELKNEMADAPTDFLRLFKDDPIAWQAWNSSVPKKAKSSQSPILAFVVSSRDGGCRDTAQRILADKEMMDLFKAGNVCTIVDIHANPEVGLLSYILASETRQPVGFPMLIWMSHEACPLAWLPIADLKTKDLKSALINSAAIVDDTWKKSSDYAVRNSRRDIEARQKRLDSEIQGAEDEAKRIDIFRRQARQTASLYDPISGNIDGAGGLVPSSALELLSLGHLSPALSKGVRQRSKEAITGVITSIEKGALHDPLDGFYFYARRSQDWSLPAFSKDLGTQAQYATALIHAGQAVENQNFINTGLAIITKLQKDWLGHNYTNESSLLEKKVPGLFLWDWDILEKTLSPEEFAVAEAAFRLNKNGNIPVFSDPTSQFRGLNSLSSSATIDEIATAVSSTPTETKPTLEKVISKLREHREKTGSIFRETQVAAQDRAQFCLAQLAAWSATGSSSDLAEAVASGNLIKNEHDIEGKQLTRFPSTLAVKARGSDYARSILAGIGLYQATLDPEWLVWSSHLAHEALDLLTEGDDDPLISEITEEDRIIPIRIRNHSMIFSESTLGLFDQAISGIAALTGDERLLKTRIAIAKSLSGPSERLPIIHTDYIASCILTETPLVAVLSGEFQDSGYQNFIKQLNHAKFSSFVTLRSDKQDGGLSPLPDFESFGNATGITLVRGSEIIGQARTIAQFRELLQSELSQKE
ncbi:MAG: DUF255 domain-containing protein [Akkermansiaceae bacterium]